MDNSKAEQQTAEAYNRLPYPSRPYPFGHPDRLAVAARLRGLAPPEVQTARVLEIGCSDGGNLLSLAFGLSDATCVGIDVSPRQIRMARRAATAVGLGNVTFRDVGILEFEDDAPFDYIIVHGVLSWIPAEVAERLLRSIRQHLSPHGVAYVSFNVYPGWLENRMIRDMMRFHTRDMTEPAEKADEAVAFLGAVADAAADIGSPEAGRLRGLHGRISDPANSAAYLFHEYLEEHNQPLYFHEFARRVSDAGLAYVSDADPVPYDIDNLPPTTADAIRVWSHNAVEVQQYIDFVRGTRFRRAVLCRDDADLAEGLLPDAIRSLRAATRYRPAERGDTSDDGAPSSFKTDSGETLTAESPQTAALLTQLARKWPADCSYDEPAVDVPGVDMAALLLALYRSGVVILRTATPRCCTGISDRPEASQLARWQVRRGVCVTSQLHRPVDLDDPAARFILPLLDGTRTVGDVAACMEKAVADGRLQIDYRGKPLAEQVGLADVLPSFVRFHLGKMIELGLLVG